MSGFNLCHDLLDKQLVDRHLRKIGRVDDVVLELRADGTTRLRAILVGAPARAQRVARWWAAGARLGRRMLGRRPAETTRIDFDRIRVIGKWIDVDVDGTALPAMRVERVLRRIVRRVPGSESGEEPGGDGE